MTLGRKNRRVEKSGDQKSVTMEPIRELMRALNDLKRLVNPVLVSRNQDHHYTLVQWPSTVRTFAAEYITYICAPFMALPNCVIDNWLLLLVGTILS